jgi:D-galactarolactone cycloisomerase
MQPAAPPLLYVIIGCRDIRVRFLPFRPRFPSIKIRDIKTHRLEAALAEEFAYSQAWYERCSALLVAIVVEDGSSGWGEAFGPPTLTSPIVDFYRSLLVGADAVATELHWQNLYNRLRDHGRKGLAISWHP